MGRAKQLLPYRGVTLLRHAVNGALDSGCRPVVVVIGSEAALMRGELAGLPVQIVENREWAKGMGSSIRAGLAALLAETSPPAVAIMLCDQPAVTGAVVHRLIERYQSTHSPIVASWYNGAAGVPALFDATLYDRLLELEDSGGAREIIYRYLDTAERIEFPEGADDVDTLEHYQRWK